MAALRLLRDDALLHDVTFAFSDGEERGAHRCVLAYQSPVFRAMFDLNSPLRAGCTPESPHPFPVTMHLLVGAIKKLRAVEAKSGGSATAECDLWRGMKNLRTAQGFLHDGGTELATMSTSADLSVALTYSRSPSSLLLKIHTKSFMNRGAAIAYLSAFPAESELVYPPLTYLRPTGRSMEEQSSDGSVKITVVEVEPIMG